MDALSPTDPLWLHVNALVGGLFLLATLGVVAIRQVLACMRLFVLQSLLLAAAALTQALPDNSIHLMTAAALILVSRAIVIPWLLRRTLHREVFVRREIDQVLSIPTSLLIAFALVLLAFLVTRPLLEGSGDSFASASLPLGLAALLLGAYTISIRREAVPQLLGILAAENGVFLAGIAVAGTLPFVVEIAVTLDVLIVAMVLGLLTRRIYEQTGSTAVGHLDARREGSAR